MRKNCQIWGMMSLGYHIIGEKYAKAQGKCQKVENINQKNLYTNGFKNYWKKYFVPKNSFGNSICRNERLF